MDLSNTTTQGLIATIFNDHDDIVTFYARVEFTDRCNTNWRTYAPVKPRRVVHTAAGNVDWVDFLTDRANFV